ncbi:HWE histidine kinase domain-containing protein [Hansschlegelia sp.]|uniref:HWE histidine kinase domain-containing protein n=1 Tax=Hansschlegelia sp. TaxID=2041892 RepID=UPI002B861122|nr:HWE histidine kinase domain-containing protein [Hansschlegelia sp.]HVI28632.1 HWE histidine kinase domain-containing protein [Hansschlegelia sp.]
MNVEDLYRLLRTSHIEAQGIVDTVPDPLLVLDENLRIQNASRSFYQTFRVDRYETVGRHLHQIGNGQWDDPDLRELLLNVIPRSAAVIDYRIEHEFPEIGRRTMLVTARRLIHPDDGVRSMLLSIVDVTESHRRDVAKDMLFDEMRHRMKNLLALATAIAHQTAAEGRSAEEYRDAFLGRFNALVEAHDMAFLEQTRSSLAELVERALAPYKGSPEKIAIDPDGDVELAPRAMMSLSLVLHELATNAAKYGSLSAPEGRVRVGWRIEGAGGELRLEWVESGGPPVNPPSRAGYGAQLIKSATTYSLGGQVEQEFAPTGLKTEIVIPLKAASRTA